MSHPPDGFPFPLEPGERVLLRVRRHWIAFWPRFAALVLTASLPAGLAIGMLIRLGIVAPIAWRLGFGAIAIWVGYFLSRAVLCKYRYERVEHVLTDRRLISVCQAGVFRFETSATLLTHIVEVRSRASGLPATVLRYGDVDFRTGDGNAGGQLGRVSHPQHVALQLQQACRAAHSMFAIGESTRPSQRERRR